MSTITITLDNDLKEQAQRFFEASGQDLSAAVANFLRKSVSGEPVAAETPAPVEKSTRYLLDPDPSKTPVFGCMKGQFTVPDDFNEPLEDLMEYMY